MLRDSTLRRWAQQFEKDLTSGRMVYIYTTRHNTVIATQNNLKLAEAKDEATLFRLVRKALGTKHFSFMFEN